MVADATRPERPEEMSQLIRRDRIPGADVDSPPLFKRRPAIDADQPPHRIEEAAAGVAGIDRGINLNAVGVFQDRARGKLVAMHAGDDARADRRLQISTKQEGVADGEAFVANLHAIAIGHLGDRKIIAAEQFHDRQVTRGIDAHEHRVVEPPVGEPTGDRRAGGLHDVEVGGGIAVASEQHAGASPGVAGEDRHGRRRSSADRVDPGLLGLKDGGIDLDATGDRGHGHHDRDDQAPKATMSSSD